MFWFSLSFYFSSLLTYKFPDCINNCVYSWFYYACVNCESLATMSWLFFKLKFLMISLAFRSLSVFVTSLCLSRMCIFLAASVAYDLPQLYRQGNSFFNSLAHLLTCFFLKVSLLLIYILASFFISRFSIRWVTSLCCYSNKSLLSLLFAWNLLICWLFYI